MIVFGGTSVGTLVFAFVIDSSLKGYGFTFCLIILGCITINQTVMGALLRPSQMSHPVGNKAESKQEESDSTHISNNLLTDIELNGHTLQYETPCAKDNEGSKIDPQEEVTLFTSGAASGKISERPSSTTDSASRSGCCAFMIKNYNLSLLKNPVYVSFIFMMSTVAFATEMSNFFMASWANERGVSLKHSAWLIALSIVTEMVTRFICGIIFDFRTIRAKRKIILGFITLAACCCVTLYATAFDIVTVILVYCVSRTLIASIWLLESVILADIATPEKMHGGLAISKIFRLVNPLLGPLLGGRYLCIVKLSTL